MGSVNILEYVKSSKYVKSLIYVTSDKVYENNETNRIFKEHNRLGGSDPYSSSKVAAECLFDGYTKSFFMNKNIGIATVRSGNVIGEEIGQKIELYPTLLNQLRKKEN